MKISPMVPVGALLPLALLSGASPKPLVDAKESYLHGLRCVEGGGVKDYAAAARLYRQAAEAGYTPAQYDRKAAAEAQAVRWFRAAAQQDDLEATGTLAMMYLLGRGVPRDLDQAFDLFQKAAERGCAVAQNNLALRCANGQAAPRDFRWAPAWLDLAAKQLPACAELRDRIAEKMTTENLSRAHDLVTRKRAEIALKEQESK